MKEYKLKKDLPGLKAGEKFILKNGFLMVDCDDPISETIDYSLKALKELIKEGDYDKRLEEIKESKSIYELKEGDEYYFIADNGIICSTEKDEEYNNSLEIGNVFLTKEEAERELEKRKALAKIKKLIWENKIITVKKGGYIIVYNEVEKDLKPYKHIPLYTSRDEIQFKNDYDVFKCLQECRKEREILFDLK